MERQVPLEEQIAHKDTSSKMLQGLLMALESVFTELSGKASDSLKLIDLGKKDEFAKDLEESIRNPLQSMDNAYNALRKSISAGKEVLITKFIKTKTHLINKAAIVNEQNATHVFIVLKNDNEENRDVFYSFIEKYESYEILNDFPIIMHFINKELMKSITDPIHVNLGDEQISKPK